MCRAPPKPSPTPSPQPIICIYCGSSGHRSMECENRPQDNREEGRIPNPVSSGYRQWKPATASSDSSYKTNARSKNSEKAGTTKATNRGDQRRADNTNNHHNAPHRANQIIKIIFLTGIIGIVTSQGRHISTRSKIRGIHHSTLLLPLHYLQAPIY